jgi:hypothetical protein
MLSYTVAETVMTMTNWIVAILRRLALFLMTTILVYAGTAIAQIKVAHKVNPIAQPSEMSCWAAAATMLVNWKSGINRSIPQVVALAGPRFVQIYNSSFATPSIGINQTDEDEFYKSLNLKVVRHSNPTIKSWSDILTKHGPLSVTVDAVPGRGFIHALLVTALDGDGTAKNTIVTYIDPAGGHKRDVRFEEFLQLYEGSAEWPLQIIYNP